MTTTKNFFISIMTLFFSLSQGYAAEFISPSSGGAAQISINSVLITSADGKQFASMRLVAKDHKGLHEGQVYRADIGGAGSHHPDARYDTANEVLSINHLQQANILSHHTVLKVVSHSPLEFAVVQLSTLVTAPPQNSFFDSSSMHRIKLPKAKHKSK
jgi:hypothetical protein